MCFDSEGGERDLESAYLYFSAAARVTHPESFAGEILWRKRQEVADLLSPDKLRALLQRLDTEFPGPDAPSALNAPYANADNVAKGRALSKDMEVQHRNALFRDKR
jgi:hypothetical protein